MLRTTVMLVACVAAMVGVFTHQGHSEDEPQRLKKQDDPPPPAVKWSTVISAEAIEDEVKITAQELVKDVTKPLSFARGDYRRARRHFSMLAALFAVIGEYDGDIRWQQQAPDLRDRFARTARNCKVGSEQAFDEAEQLRDDLNEVVRGRAMMDQQADRNADWSDVADRSPLMQRNEQALQGTLAPDTTGEAKFKENRDAIIREASLVAAIATILTQPGMPEADDEDYRKHAEQLRDSAQAIITATKLGNLDQARASVGKLQQSCSNCHADWR